MTTTSRRTDLRGSMAALITGIAIPTGAGAANPDGEMITLCHRLVELEAAYDALCSTIEDDDERDAALLPVETEKSQIVSRVEEIGNPTTMEGAKAMARIALAHVPKGLDGTLRVGSNPEDWFFVCIAEFLTGSAVA
jgi:hypothetical protein